MAEAVRLLLCGDVMTGRGIDQILPHPGDPMLYEQYVHSALDYVTLAEQKNGPIARPADFHYVWGDALVALDHEMPAVRVVNLETSITTSNDYVPKGINYRMHPANIGTLAAAKIDCCVVANNHVLDFGTGGLDETLRTLENAGILHAGAGRNRTEADAPARFPLPGGGRLLVFAFGSVTSGIPPSWAAGPDRPGVNVLQDFSQHELEQIARQVRSVRRDGDICLASVHWGANWGYRIEPAYRVFAHELIATAGFDVVHGHSSHHAKAIEIYRDRLVLFGCGDFITDYEGIEGYDEFRSDFAVMYLPELAAPGTLIALKAIPFRMRQFHLARATKQDTLWLQTTLERESAPLGTHVMLNADLTLSIARA